MSRRLFAAGLAAGLIAAGCGDDDDSAADHPPPTKQEFIARADEICRAGDRQINTAGREFFAGVSEGGEPSQSAIAEFGQQEVLPAFERTIDRLADLPVPEGDEEVISAILTAARDGIERLREQPELILDDEPSEADRLFAQYGIDTCGESEEDEDDSD
jgi:hypothetical protein